MLSLLKRIWPATPHQAAAEALYLKAVEKARDPAFYALLGVPDTLDGRFDMIVLHTGLTVRSLRRGGKGSPAWRVAQEMFDLMFADFDRSLREMGVGDMGVGKHIKRMGKAWYARVAAYDSAIDSAQSDDMSALEATLRETMFRARPEAAVTAPLARYILRTEAHLAAQPLDDIAAGTIDWTVSATDDGR